MKLKLLFALLFAIVSNAQTQIGQDIVGDMPDDKFGHGVALSADGNVMAVSAPGNDNNGTDAGHIRVYSKTSGTWTQIGQDIEGPNPDDQIGYKIALSDDGSVLAFSAPYSATNYTPSNGWPIVLKGFISIFKNVNGTWTQIGQDIKQDTTWVLDYYFGLAISLSGDGSTIAISNPDSHPNNPQIQIFKNISNSWTKIGEFEAANFFDEIPSNSFGNAFGFNVSLSFDGSIVAFSDIGEYNKNGGKNGFVVVYKYQLGNWVKVGNTLFGNSNKDYFGIRVALSKDGSVLAIAANKSDINGTDSGKVEVYKINGNSWFQIGNDILGEAVGDLCGFGLAMSANGNALAVGCVGCDTANGSDTGKVRIFENIQNNWVEKGSVIGANAGDGIGWSIALSKDGYNLVVGNPGSSSVGGKLYTTNFEEQTVSDNLFQANNYQAKGTFPGSVQVFNLSGILSSDSFVLENFNIYPNPTTDIINIELKENLMLEKVLIYNTSGQLVKETAENKINVSGFAKGIYNVQVLTNQGKATKKVIVK